MCDPNYPDIEYNLSNIEDTTCTIFNWLMQTISWLILISIFVSFLCMKKIDFVIFSVLYLLYIIIENLFSYT